MNTVKLKNTKKSPIVLILALVFYVASAIAFESTAETAKISTLAIYFLFLVGGYYILKNNIIHFSTYVVCVISFAIYIFIMYIPMLFMELENVSNSSYHVMYVSLTCAILCIIVYMITYHNPEIIKWIILANILGALILTIRIVVAYGGIAELIEYASEEGEHRIGSLIINENLLGLYMSNAVLSSMVFIVNIRRKFLAKTALVVLCACFASLALLAGSKKATAYILVGVVTMILFASKGQRSGKKAVFFTIGLFSVLFLVWAINNLEVFSTIRFRIEEMFLTFSGKKVSQTDMNRVRFVNEGIETFWKSPLFGNGTGYSYKLFNTYSHNNFVELLMNYGIVGFSLHYLPRIVVAVMLYRKVKCQDVFAMYMFVYVIIQFFMEFALVSYYDRVMQLIVACAWGYCESKRTRSGQNEI